MEMLSPGVSVKEVDFATYIRSLSTATAGFVGAFERGPVGEAVLVTSLEDAKRKFGYASQGIVDGHWGMLALRGFFENGGARAYVVRAATASAVKATATLVDRDGTPADTLQVDAADAGTWGNDLSVEIAASSALPATGFNLIVKTDAGTTLETFKDLVLDAASADYVEKRVNGVSAYITVTDLESATATPLPALGTNTLASGVDGLPSAAVDFTDHLSALDAYAVSFVAIPGESDVSSVAVALKDYAEGRKDCIAILETPQGATAQGLADHRTGLGIDSSYAALYGPWLEDEHPITGRKIVVPPTGVVAGIYARNDAEGAVWTIPAGVQRASVRGVLAPEILLTPSERDVIYPEGVNPIAVVAGTLQVYGQKTLQKKASPLDRVNVRRMMAYIEKSVMDAAQFVVFEINDSTTWNTFLRTVDPFMARIKSGRGVYDYRVICDASINTPAVIDANQMKAVIQVQPAKGAEFITVEFALAQTGANFSEL